MKKTLLKPLLLSSGVLLVCLAPFFLKGLRDAVPAVKSPAVDIVRLVEQLDADTPEFKEDRVKAYPFDLRTIKALTQKKTEEQAARDQNTPGKR